MTQARPRRPYWFGLLAALVALALPFSMAPLSEAGAQEKKGSKEDNLEDVVIVVGGAKKDLFPIAIPDIKVTSGTDKDKYGRNLAQVLRDDLELTGYFKVLDPKSFGVVDLDKDGVEAKEVDFKAWELTGAQGVVKGLSSLDGSSLSSEVRLIVGGKAISLKNQGWRGSADEARRHMHEVANDIIEYFTGTRGVFGTQIAFVKKEGPGKKDVYVMDSDGQGMRRITANGSVNMLPSFASGGILYTSFAAKNPDLYFYDFGKKSSTKISDRNGLNTGGVMSPAGGKIALTLSKDGNSEIYTIGTDGKIIARLTESSGIDTSPSWSPDGSKIAFVSDRGGSPQIYVMNSDGSGAKKLTTRGKFNQTPEWSPKGDKIAFTGRDESGRYDIFLADVKTGDLTRITQKQGSNQDPTFSPDGRLLAFSSTRDGGEQIFISSLDGLYQKKITEKGTNLSPSWSRK
jgi:TolB protein